MLRLMTLAITLILCDLLVQAQYPIECTSDTFNFKEAYKEKGVSSYWINFYVKFPADSINEENKYLNFVIKETYGSRQKQYKVPQQIVVGTYKDSAYAGKFPFEVLNDLVAEDTGRYMFTISAPSHDSISDKSIKVNIIDATEEFDPKDMFRFTVGANFDFIDGVDPNSVYAEASFNKFGIIENEHDSIWLIRKRAKKDIGFWPFGKYELYRKAKTGKLSFDLNAGIYQNRSITVKDSSFSERIERVDTISPGISEYKKYLTKDVYSISTKLIGFYMAPTFRWDLSRWSKTNTHIGIGLYNEALTRNFTTVVNSTDVDSTTFGGPVDSIPYNVNVIGKKTIPTTLNEFYLGIGVPLFVGSDKAEFTLRSYFGFEWQKHNFDGTLSERLNKFYLFRFGILEKEVGLHLGGEVRGFFGQETHYTSIFLAKTFGMKHFLKYGG